MEVNKNNDPMIGKSFGTITVVTFSHTGPRGHKYYVCICNRCGNKPVYRGVNLRLGKITRCKECWLHENRNKDKTE